MLRSLLLVPTLLALGCACSNNKPETQAPPAAKDGTVAPAATPAPEPPPPPPPRAPLRLEPNSKQTTSAGVDIELVDFVVESIEPDPEDSNATGGDGAIATVQIGHERVTLSEMPEGYTSHRDVWTRTAHVRLVEMGGPPSPFIAIHVDRITDRVVEGSERDIVIEKKQSAEIGPDTRMTFLGHGHKMVSSGQRSPLIVAVEYTVGDGAAEDDSYSIYPPEESRFTWRNYVFDLKDHEYDGSMTLEVHRLELEPLVAASE